MFCVYVHTYICTYKYVRNKERIGRRGEVPPLRWRLAKPTLGIRVGGEWGGSYIVRLVAQLTGKLLVRRPYP